MNNLQKLLKPKSKKEIINNLKRKKLSDLKYEILQTRIMIVSLIERIEYSSKNEFELRNSLNQKIQNLIYYQIILEKIIAKIKRKKIIITILSYVFLYSIFSCIVYFIMQKFQDSQNLFFWIIYELILIPIATFDLTEIIKIIFKLD